MDTWPVPYRGQRRVGGRDDRCDAGLLEVARNDRTEVGQRRLRPVDRCQLVARLPWVQTSRRGAGTPEHAAVVAQRKFPHPLQDEELEADDHRRVGDRADPCTADHGTGT
jgi:hypothetical protein